MRCQALSGAPSDTEILPEEDHFLKMNNKLLPSFLISVCKYLKRVLVKLGNHCVKVTGTVVFLNSYPWGLFRLNA